MNIDSKAKIMWLEADYGDEGGGWKPGVKTMSYGGTFWEVRGRVFYSGVAYNGHKVFFAQSPSGDSCFYFIDKKDEEAALAETPQKRISNSKIKSTNMVVANALKAHNARAVVKNGKFTSEFNSLLRISDRDARETEAKKIIPQVKAHYYKLINEAKDLHGDYDKCIWDAMKYKTSLGKIRDEIKELISIGKAGGDMSLVSEMQSMASGDLFGSFRSL